METANAFVDDKLCDVVVKYEIRWSSKLFKPHCVNPPNMVCLRFFFISPSKVFTSVLTSGRTVASSLAKCYPIKEHDIRAPTHESSAHLCMVCVAWTNLQSQSIGSIWFLLCSVNVVWWPKESHAKQPASCWDHWLMLAGAMGLHMSSTMWCGTHRSCNGL